ncbi:MAG: DNA-processing protein DprA [Lentisphaeria bacterium]|nr:DNA-processing protein DprA [Lentisphaeria bacterium]
MERVEAWVVLNMLPGIGPLRARQLLTACGSPQAILEASSSKLVRVPGMGAHLADVVSQWRVHCDLEKEMSMVEQAGVALLTQDDDDYPELLARIYDPPLCLYVRGDRSVLPTLRGAVAIVGSRRTTQYGVQMARRLATAAAYAGWPVVSGLARGIDTVAHEAVLQADGRTVSVLGSGLGRVYPQENVDLARRMAASRGAVVSEFPMMSRPDKHTFPMRNRIISGMTRGTIVVEAGVKSGSLITASQALEQNRQVFAVPGRVDSPQSRGCHMLIKDGAALVEGFEDILEEFASLPGLGVRPYSAPSVEPACGDGQSEAGDLQLPELEQSIYALVDQNEMGIDDIVTALEEPPSKVLSSLLMLEMRHLVRQLPGRRVVRRQNDMVG